MSRSGLPRSLALLAVAALLLPALSGVGLPGRAHAARLAPSASPCPGSPALTGSIAGPSEIGSRLKANYTVQATGGCAVAQNGTLVGTYAFTATLTGRNTTSAVVLPSTGVLLNGTRTLQITAPNLLETMTLNVLVTSGFKGANASNNLTYTIAVVQPFNVNATLLVASNASVGPFSLAVTLDGVRVGSVRVPVLSPGASYPISFSYVATGLSIGWHTFAISLAELHGLVVFPGGVQQYSESFYVAGPPPDYNAWYLAGTSAFIGAILIWRARVAARRRGRTKK